MPRLMPRVLAAIAIIAVFGLSACGGDDENSSGGGASTDEATTTESPSPSAQADALKDTSVKPVIPKPTGSPPRRLVKEDIVKGKGPPAKPGDSLVVNYVGMN